MCRQGKLTCRCLSRQPHLAPPEEGISEGDVQVCAIIGSLTGEESIESLLQPVIVEPDELVDNQRKDKDLKPIITYFEEKCLPDDKTKA